MSRSHFSPHWYRVADLVATLRTHVEIHRHVLRGAVWYVLQDAQSGRFFRISPEAYRFLDLLDGRRSVAGAWHTLGRELGERQPTQDEMIQLLAQLYRSDLLRGDVPADLDELVHRRDTAERRRLISRVQNPMALRFPLLDPDAFLERTLPLVAPAFSAAGLLVWAGIVGFGALIAVLHWDTLTGNLADRVLTADNLLIMLALYPAIKALHELGHAYAVKAWGGEVHELGIMLLVFMPVPYVDATAASQFRSRWRRALTGAAGIMVEALLAAVAMVVWVEAEPGLLHAVAFNVALIGGVSTVLFNGNPLLRFDGYYVLSDLIDIPNLGPRANRYLLWLLRRIAFGDAERPRATAGEAAWFVVYGIAAFVYRLFVLMWISALVATKFFFLGVLLALWVIGNAIVRPLARGFAFVFLSERLGHRQARAKRVTALGAAAAAAVLFLVPVPNATVAEGVLAPGEDAQVVAGAPGFVAALHAAPGDAVAAGDPLVSLTDPALEAELAHLGAVLRELEARLAAARSDPVEAGIVAEQLSRSRAAFDLLDERRRALTVTAPRAGRFVLAEATDLAGRYVAEGQLIGYVTAAADRTVSVAVPQYRAGEVQGDTRAVQVRRVSRPDRAVAARLVRAVPAAIERLPSPVLSTAAGGTIALLPDDPKALRPLQRVYRFDVRLAAGAPAPMIDERVFVRFEHAPSPIGFQLLRRLRQIFLSRFDV